MELDRHDFSRGILRVGDLLISPRTYRSELEGQYAARGETGGSVSYLLLRTVSFAGVAMTVRCLFRRDRLAQVTLSPADAAGPREAHGLSRAFLEALMGCTDKTYPWGRVETRLFPDYHDDYHGGDVYITYF